MGTCVHRLGLTAPSVSCGKTALAIRVNGSIIIFCSTIDFDWSVVLRLLTVGVVIYKNVQKLTVILING